MENATGEKTLDIKSVTEAAEYLHMAPGTLRVWRHQGKGPRSFTFGSRVFYMVADLEQWAKAQYAQAVGDHPVAS
jgi:Helix-turn-helix domain